MTSTATRIGRAMIVVLSLAALSCASIQPRPSSPSPVVSGDYATVNGIRLYFEVHGEARDGRVPLVLIHGGGSTIESNWSRILPLLARERQVIAIEEQGHGHSPAAERPFTFENTADDVAALLDHLKIARADVMGFSNGGSTTLRVGLRHPDKVRRLVVISAMYRRDGMLAGFWDGLEGARLSAMPEALQAADRKINPDPRHLQALFEQDLGRIRAFQGWPDADVSGIAAPTLVVVGDHDVVLPEHALRMARLLPKGRLMIVPGGHGDFLGEVASARSGSATPAAVTALVAAFLEE
jgi:pimeloyl-ACP methyl ester carboxylesterase